MALRPGYIPPQTADDVTITGEEDEKELYEKQKQLHKIQRQWMLVSAQEKSQDETIKTLIRNI